MVQGRENLTRIVGRIVHRTRHNRLPDWDLVRVELTDATPVAGVADVLSARRGSVVDLAVRRALLGDACGGAVLRCRAKATADGAMCEPWPADGDFAISDTTTD
jgi:hypothetical protein